MGTGYNVSAKETDYTFRCGECLLAVNACPAYRLFDLASRVEYDSFPIIQNAAGLREGDAERRSSVNYIANVIDGSIRFRGWCMG